MDEIDREGTFRTIVINQQKEKKIGAEIKATRGRMKETVETTKRIVGELKEFADEKRRDEQTQMQVIHKLQDDLHELKVSSEGMLVDRRQKASWRESTIERKQRHI